MKQTYFTNTAEIWRLTTETGTDKESWATISIDVCCNIQPLDDSFNEDMEGSYGKDYLMFTDEEDIIIGDKIVDGSDNEYLVKGVRRFELATFSITEVKLRTTL